MQITQAEIDRYREAISKRQVEAAAYVRARLEAEGMRPGGDGYRTRAVEIMRDCMGVYGDQAQALSATLFDEVCEAEGIDARAVMFDDVIDGTAMAEKIGYYAGVDGDDWDRYLGHNADLAALYVHKSALENMVRNCRAGGVQFARVATGRETCGWCFMLSSRGFAYSTRRTAEASSHHHCDCVIVPGRKGVTKIRGYDPGAMAKRWAQCASALPSRDDYRREWAAMPASEKARYAPKGKGKRGSAKPDFDAYYSRQVMRECETRDREWLYRGIVSEPTYATESVRKAVTKTNPWEGETAARLAKHGIKPDHIQDFIWEIGDDGIKRKVGLPDLAGGVELKTPMGSNNPYGAVKNYFDNSARKRGLKRIVIDNTKSKFTDDDLERAMKSLVGEYDFPLVSFLGKSGELKNVK